MQRLAAKPCPDLRLRMEQYPVLIARLEQVERLLAAAGLPACCRGDGADGLPRLTDRYCHRLPAGNHVNIHHAASSHPGAGDNDVIVTPRPVRASVRPKTHSAGTPVHSDQESTTGREGVVLPDS